MADNQDRGENDSQYTTGIKRYRERAYAVHKAECKFCNEKENLHIHHIDGDRTHNEVDNLVPLCEACHAKLHSLGRRGANLMKFLEELPDENTYYSYILPLIHGMMRKNHLRRIHNCICECCGRKYKEKESRIERTKYCSRQCQGKALAQQSKGD